MINTLDDSCEKCSFDYSGTWLSIRLMLIVLISVISPMLLVIFAAFLIRICCPKIIKRSESQHLKYGSKSIVSVA